LAAVPKFEDMGGNIIVWDLETVPDLQGFAVLDRI